MNRTITPIDNAKLRDAIFRAGKTQAQVARSVGIHPNILSAAIRGRINLYTNEVEKIADVLGVSTREFYAG